MKKMWAVRQKIINILCLWGGGGGGGEAGLWENT